MRANRPPGQGPAISICGLGINPPTDATLEALRELGACRVVFSDLADKKSYSWLGRMVGRLRKPKDAREVVCAARRGGLTGLAVWGHACHTSPLAFKVAELSRREEVPCRFFGSLSPISSVLARSGVCLGWDRRSFEGMRAYSLKAILGAPVSPRNRLPLVVFSDNGSPSDWKRLADGLLESFPPEHPVDVYLSGEREPRRVSLGRLPARTLRNAVVMLPGLEHA
ncbi:MAG: hypothetical protein HY077_16555 [Elusimicrobia bacterium]|nr:hypothetical protein [Elusimicrobiota bacterium]